MQSAVNKLNAKQNKMNGTTNPHPVFEASDGDKIMMTGRTTEILPTSKQKPVTNDWYAAVRKVWNVALHDIKKQLELNPEYIPTEYELRDKYVIKSRMSPEIIKQLGWTFRTSKRIREYAIIDLVATFKQWKTCQEKIKFRNGREYPFNTQPKSRHSPRQSISISKEGSRIQDGKLHTNGLQFKLRETHPDGPLEHNARLTRFNGLFFLALVTSSTPSKTIRVCKTDRIVGYDPGERIPFVYYSPSGEWGEIGVGLQERLKSLYTKEMKIKGRNPKSSRLKRLARHIKGLVDDFHWKLAYWTLDNFKVIIIPRLYVGKCSAERRRLQGDIRHCLFVDRLIHVSRLYPDSRIIVGNERYTTKSCTACLSLRTTKDRVVTCKDCGFVAHRDFAGARNQFFRNVKST